MSNKDRLFSYFNLSFDENDLNLQDSSFNLLNQIIEKIVILRYKKSLDSFKYSSTGDIYEELYSLYSSKKSKEQVELFAKEMYEYIGEAVPLSRIITDIESCLEYLSFMSGVYSPTSLTEKLSEAIQGDDYESAYSIISQSFKNNRFYHEIIGYNLIQNITKNDDNFQKLVIAITKNIEKLHKSNPNYIQDLKYQQQTHPDKYLDLNIIQAIQNQKYQEVAGVIAKKIIDNKDYHELTAFIDSFMEEGGKDFISFIASKTMDPISLFCNKVLNHAEDKWKREETEKIKASTKGHLKVTEKLKNRYYKSRVMEYIEHCIRNNIPYDDYTLSKQLGITQSRIRSLKERKELKYPHEGFEWKTVFAESIKNAKYDENDHYIKVIIQDINVMSEIRHYIEEKGWYDECSLNKKLLRIPFDCFLEICSEDEASLYVEIKSKPE